jgi:hypothetical protein
MRFVPWIAIGAGAGFFAFAIASIVPRPATLEVSPGELRPSWTGPIPLTDARITIGRWVMPVIDSVTGLAIHVGGIRIGGTDHPGDGYRVDAAPARAVDFELSAADLDALASAIGVPRAAPDGTVIVELVRSSQSAGGAFRTMAPWLLTMVVLSVGGVALGATGLADRLLRHPHGMIWMGVGTGAIVVAGMAWTIVRSMRPRIPSLELRATADTLGLFAYRGAEQVRVPWAAVRAEPRSLVLRTKGGTWTLPALELHLGDHVLQLACWDQREAWPQPAPRASPTWIAGRPHWRQLLTALQVRGTCMPR